MNVIVSALSSIPAIGFIFSIISLALIIPSLAVAWRRTHDVGKGGGWNFCPIYNIVLWCTPSEMTPNRFGPVPPNA